MIRIAVLLLLSFTSAVNAEDLPAPVPIVTGAFGFLASGTSGHQEFGPKFEPVLLLPLGRNLLVEAEYSMELPVAIDNGRTGPAVLTHGFEYLQLDITVTSNLTAVVGNFVTPFGIYKERLDPLWIRNLIETPILFAINDNSSTGAMFRGGFFLNPSVKVNYAASYSTEVDNSQISSARQTGGRLSIYLPRHRLELGGSFSRVLSGQAYSVTGFDVTWKPVRLPLEVRGEGVTSSALGSGFWLEGAHGFRSSKSGALRRSQAVARIERFAPTRSVGDFNGDLPDASTTRLTLGWNYWLRQSLRASVAYTRQWETGPANGFSVGLVYFFIFPGHIG